MKTTHDKGAAGRLAVIYCRVSTREQAEEGNSLVTQERLCREFAAKSGYAVAAVFVDQGESAKTADRPQLKRMLGFCTAKRNRIRSVLLYKLDRLSRNADDYSQMRILLRRYGVEVRSVTEHFEDSPMGRFMENIIANVAQFDNDIRTERSVGGMREALREGRYVWKAPVGYRNARVGGKAAIVQSDDARHIRRIFELLASRGRSVSEVREIAAREGFLTPRGTPFCRSSFYRILRNEMYCGWTTKFGERLRCTGDPILTEELFGRVQRVLDHAKEKKPYRTGIQDFPLRRFLLHADGEKYTGSWSKGRDRRYPYYRANRSRACIRKHAMEEAFCRLLEGHAHSPESFDSLRGSLREYLRRAESQARAVRGRTEERIAALKEGLQAAVQKNLSGIIDDATLGAVLERQNGHIAREQLKLAGMQSWSKRIADRLDGVAEAFVRPHLLWPGLPFHEKIKMQWLLFPAGIRRDGESLAPKETGALLKAGEALRQPLDIEFLNQFILDLGVLETIVASKKANKTEENSTE